jgi:hypothetical protein
LDVEDSDDDASDQRGLHRGSASCGGGASTTTGDHKRRRKEGSDDESGEFNSDADTDSQPAGVGSAKKRQSAARVSAEIVEAFEKTLPSAVEKKSGKRWSALPRSLRCR